MLEALVVALVGKALIILIVVIILALIGLAAVVRRFL